MRKLMTVFVVVAATAIMAPVTAAEATTCKKVPGATRSLLVSHLEGVDVGLGKLRAVKSKDFSSVHFVSGRLTGPDVDDEIATWAIGGPLGTPRLIMSVGGFAHEFSDWLHGEDSDAELSIADDGYDASRDCV